MKQNSPQHSNHYDTIVIGAGSGGLTVAIGLAQANTSVLLIEREKPGGECTHSGCIPSKALLHQAKSMHESGKIDAARALDITRERIQYIYQEETPEKLERSGVVYVSGDAVFTGTHTLTVHETTYTFKKAVLATGSSPRNIEIAGLKEDDLLTNQNFFTQTDIPKRLLIIGSGPIGMEMAQACAMLGSQVHVASIDSDFARLEDPAVSEILKKKFTELGIAVTLNAYIQKVEGNTAFFEIKKDDQVIDEVQVEFDKVLIAIGRVPNIPQGLEQAGITYKSYGIVIDEHYRTSNKHVFAIGDVSQQLKFTHTANNAGRSVVQNILTHGWWKDRTKKAVPKVTYTLPEVAQVGMMYEAAQAKYGESRIVRLEVPFSSLDRAKTDFLEEGLAVIVAKRLSGTIIGVNIIGSHAGELLAPFTIAIDHNLSLWKLRSTIFPYPTLSEITRKVGDEYLYYTIKNLKSDIFAQIKLNLTKIIAGIIWIATLVLFYMLKSHYGASYKDIFTMLYNFLSTNTLGPIIYILAYTLRPILFFPASVMTILSGLLFGPLLGVLYTIVGSNTSASVAYWIGRFFAGDIHIEDNKLFGTWIAKAQKNPFVAIVTMRFIYLPYDLVNYGSGIAKIHWGVFALATMLSILPGTITFVLLGASLDITEITSASDIAQGFHPYTFLAAVALFIATLLVNRYYQKRYA